MQVIDLYAFSFHSQSKYKEVGKKELVNCLYSLLPETKDTLHAKEQTQLHSEVQNNLQLLSGDTSQCYTVLGEIAKISNM